MALFRPHQVLPRCKWDQINSASIRHFFQAVFTALGRMVGEDVPLYEPPSSEFPRVKQLLLDAWKYTHEGRDFDRNTEGRIAFKLCIGKMTEFQRQPGPWMVQHMLALARSSRTLLPVDQQIRFPGSAATDPT